jgi:hypothetical protein
MILFVFFSSVCTVFAALKTHFKNFSLLLVCSNCQTFVNDHCQTTVYAAITGSVFLCCISHLVFKFCMIILMFFLLVVQGQRKSFKCSKSAFALLRFSCFIHV